MKFVNVYDLSDDRIKDSEDHGVSITQPDEALSIQEILDRVSRGLTTGIGASRSDEDYDSEDDNDFDDPTIQPGFDKLDALELSHGEHAQELEEEVKAARSRKKKKEQEDAFEKEVQRRLKEKEQQDPPAE